MKFEFDIYKAGNELFGIYFDINGKPYGMHLTSSSPRKAIGIYVRFNKEYDMLLHDRDSFARIWLGIYNNHMLSPMLSHEEVNDMVCIVRGKSIHVDNVWEYAYNPYVSPPLKLFMVNGRKVDK